MNKLNYLLILAVLTTGFSSFFITEEASAQPGHRVCVSNDNKYFIKIRKGKKCPTSDGYNKTVLTCEDFSRRYTRWAEWNICYEMDNTDTSDHDGGQFRPTRNGSTHPRRLNLDAELKEVSIFYVSKTHFAYGPRCGRGCSSASVRFGITQGRGTRVGIKGKGGDLLPFVEVEASASSSTSVSVSATCTVGRNKTPRLELVRRFHRFTMNDFNVKGALSCRGV